ncbi:peroxidase-like protein [Argopecten irradians]|uniref:peroxidase-like protein n=1 Tax=Argopecten irradians TaxID=31199 RepID=UPI003720C816
MNKLLLVFLVLIPSVISFHTGMSEEDLETILNDVIKTTQNSMKEEHSIEDTSDEDKDKDSKTLTSGEQLLQFGFETNRAKAISKMATINLAVTKAILKELLMALSDLRKDKEIMRIFKKTMSAMCFQPEPPCDQLNVYRTADGSCNNIANPSWGKSFTPQTRFLQAKYDDGIGSPRQKARNGGILPSARKVSNLVFKANSGPKQSPDKTVMVMAWGQFVDHDFTKTPIRSVCRPDCFSIKIPYDDHHFNKTCMPFSRSTASVSLDCMPGQREQLNTLTSYIDASNVYGSTQAEQDSVRTMINGKLRTKGNGLPERPDGCIKDQSPADYCFHAGDERVNELPSLGNTHTMFLREHNRIAKELKKINPFWTDEILFQETRKIIAAFEQQITYGEFLPVLLNDDIMTQYGLYNSPGHSDLYDDTVNAATNNAFAAAAFRFGHTLIPHFQGLMHSDMIKIDKFKTETLFLRPHLVQTKGGKNQEDLTRWMSAGPAARMDRVFEKAVRDLLFVDSKGDSFDLPSLNIQRGRDHGLPGYNDWREWCGLPRANHFEAVDGGLVDHSEDNALRLSQAYKDVDDIDLYPGAITENHIIGGGIGPTFACMLARQFRNFKIGDRFWYERPDSRHGGPEFSTDQLLEIKKITLAKIMCRNQGLAKIQPNVFRKPGYLNSNYLESCGALPDMDLTKWKAECDD